MVTLGLIHNLYILMGNLMGKPSPHLDYQWKE